MFYFYQIPRGHCFFKFFLEAVAPSCRPSVNAYADKCSYFLRQICIRHATPVEIPAANGFLSVNNHKPVHGSFRKIWDLRRVLCTRRFSSHASRTYPPSKCTHVAAMYSSSECTRVAASSHRCWAVAALRMTSTRLRQRRTCVKARKYVYHSDSMAQGRPVRKPSLTRSKNTFMDERRNLCWTTCDMYDFSIGQ